MTQTSIDYAFSETILSFNTSTFKLFKSPDDDQASWFKHDATQA